VLQCIDITLVSGSWLNIKRIILNWGTKRGDKAEQDCFNDNHRLAQSIGICMRGFAPPWSALSSLIWF